jgi:hypothetical protein
MATRVETQAPATGGSAEEDGPADGVVDGHPGEA